MVASMPLPAPVPGPDVPRLHRLAAAAVRHRTRPSGSAPAGGHGLTRIHAVTSLPAKVIDQARSSGPLESRALAIGLVLAGLLVMAGWVVLARRGGSSARWRRHRIARRLVFGSTATLLVLLGVGAAVNSYVGYLPTFSALASLLTGSGAGTGPIGQRAVGSHVQALGPTRLSTAAGSNGSQIVQLSIGAPQDGVPPQTTYVYLPPGYDNPANAQRRYPVVYLIHGYPGSSADWLRAGRAAQVLDLLQSEHLIGPMILVLPNANGGWIHDSECLNAVAGPKVESYLTGAVVDAVDRTFRTIADRTGRAIGGMSSGGYCGLNLGLRHLNTYSVILASEPYGDPGRNVIGRELGGSQALFHANSPAWYVPLMRFPMRTAVFLDAGAEDRVTSRIAAEIARQLAARGQYVALRFAPGVSHSWREARAELPYALVFAQEHLTAAH
jgi:enterochelin esterase-like enzyme